jgi:glycosyltransferase involved in cell wall biosynthesis
MDEHELNLIRNSGLFDAEWYCAQYPDVRLLDMDPAEHFLRFGWLLDRKPSRDFDPEQVMAFAGVGVSGRHNPLLAFLKHQNAACASDSSQKQPTKPATAGEVADAAPKPAKDKQAESEEADYQLLLTRFDEAYYIRRYQDIARSRMDPALHFLRHGGFEGRNPRADFDTRYYVSQNPDVKAAKINPFLHYLKVGKTEGRQPSPLSAGNQHFDHVAEMLNMAPQQLESTVADRKDDIKSRLLSGELGEMVAKAEKLDPLVKHVWLAALDPGISPIRSLAWTHQISAMHRLQEGAGWRRAKVAVLIPWVHVSGAARVAAYLTTALTSLFEPDDVVVIRTETSEFQFPEWFPDGCRHIDFAAETQAMDASNKQRLLVEFLRSLKLQHVFNLNSGTFWESLEHFGMALSQSMKLHTYLFCNEKNLHGDWVGYPVRNYHKYADILQTVICDSQFLSDELTGRFMVPQQQAESLRVLDTPINAVIAPVTPVVRRSDQRPCVYWAGRFDRQKRVDIAFAIAEQMPDVDFHFWGKPTLDRGFEKLSVPENVTLEGVYKDFEDLPLAKCDAWLYTAEWDGVPNILLDVSSAAIPLVGSIAGGTGEVLVEGLSEPVTQIEDIDAYVFALRKVFSNPAEARSRALKLRDIILGKRSSSAYLASVQSLLERENKND